LKERENNMDLDEIKKIIENEKGKVVIIENGKPTIVVSKFGENPMKAEKLAKKEIPEELKQEELKIEDLPI